jgi:hypothetical protein
VAAVLDSVITTEPPASTMERRGWLRGIMVEQLTLIRSVLDQLDALRPVHSGAASYMLAGTVRGIAVTLAGSFTAAGQGKLDFDLVAADSRWKAHLYPGNLAAPAQILTCQADGIDARPLIYESGYRACWRNLHAVLTAGSAVLVWAEHVAECVAVAETAIRA